MNLHHSCRLLSHFAVTCSWLAVAMVVVSVSAPMNARAQQPTIPGIDSAIADLVKRNEIAGAVTLVADSTGIVHLSAVGQSDIAKEQPMKTDSIFWIASMSKPITAASVMILVDEGRLSLNDPIDKHLPEMKRLKDDQGKIVSVTIEQLLNHTSGMRELNEPYKPTTLAEASLLYSSVGVQFPPGTKWQYSQTSINTAARIVEVVAGMTFDRFVEQRLCKPLKMVDTKFYLDDAQFARLAKSYKRTEAGKLEETPIWLLTGKSPIDRDRMPAANGGFFSTASDYGRFCRMLLNGGELDEVRVLSEKSVERLRTVTTGDLTTGFTNGNAWGVGCCVVRTPQGVTEMLSAGTFGHGGAYGTQAWIDPVKKRCYILMVQRANFPNGDDSEVRKTFQTIASKFLDSK